MIILNDKKFALNDNEFINSLFQTGGTCTGYYKVNKRSIMLLNIQREKIGIINKHGVLCCATIQKDDIWWYSYTTINEIGEYNSYMTQCNEIESILQKHNIQ